MTPKQINAFIAVAETLNFAQAAQRVHLSQPALSLMIKGLEDALGGRLLIRTTRRVRLTPEGEALLGVARQLLADWRNAEESLRQRFALQRGHVSLAAMPSFAANVLPQLLREFRRRHPQIDVTVRDVIYEQVLEEVAAGRVELGFAFEPEAQDFLAFTSLFNDPFVAVLPPGSSRVGRGGIDWPSLLKKDFITLQRPSMMRRLLEEQLRADGMELSVALECNQLATVGALVAQELGVSAVPALCAPMMKALGNRCVPLHSPAVARRIGLISRRGTELSSAVQAMRDVAAQLLSQADAADRVL